MQVAYFQGDPVRTELAPFRGMGMLMAFSVQVLSTSLISPRWCHIASAVLAENVQFTGIKWASALTFGVKNEARRKPHELLEVSTHTHTHAHAYRLRLKTETLGGEAERTRQMMEKRKLCIITKVQAKRLSWAAENWKDVIWKANTWVVRSRSSLSLAISGLTYKRLRFPSAKPIEIIEGAQMLTFPQHCTH